MKNKSMFIVMSLALSVIALLGYQMIPDPSTNPYVLTATVTKLGKCDSARCQAEVVLGGQKLYWSVLGPVVEGMKVYKRCAQYEDGVRCHEAETKSTTQNR